MADRYWVGGTAAWDATAGSKWATTSGGAGGAAVPTASDDVYLDAASGSVTVTISGSRVCRSLNCTGFTGTLSHPAATNLTIGTSSAGAGNIALKLDAGMTYTLGNVGTSALIFSSTSGTQQTIDTGGKTTGNITVSGTGGSYILAAAATFNNFTLTAGTFNTGNYNISSQNIATSGSVAKVLTLGSSTWTTLSTNTSVSISGSNLTLNANTSTVIFNATVNQAVWGSVTWNNLTSNGAGAVICGTVTCANLTRTGTAAQTDELVLSGNATVTGTFTVTGNSAVNRAVVRSSVFGTARTVTAANVSLTNADFMDITGAGAASPFTGTTLGDRLGNTNVTTDTPATQTFSSGSGSWSNAAKWTSRVPLPQDDVVFNGSSGNATMDVFCWGKNIDFTGYTGQLSRASSNTPNVFFGNMTMAATFDPGTTPNTYYVEARGRGAQTITSGGKSFFPATSNQRLDIYAPGGSYTLSDALLLQCTVPSAAAQLVVYAGTFDSANYNITLGALGSATTTYSRTVTLGTSTLSFYATGTITFINLAATNLTFNGASATYTITGVASTTRTLAGAGQSFGTINYTIADSIGLLAITGANTINTLNVSSGRGLQFQNGVTNTITNWNVAGANYGYQQMCTVTSSDLISTPDAAVLQVVDDMTIDVKVQLPSWSAPPRMMFLSKLNSSANNGYGLRIDTNGTLTLFAGRSQGASTVSCSTVFNANDIGWLRATRRRSDGRVQFFTSPDGTNWTQLGADVTVAANVNNNSSTALLYIGSRTTGNDIMTTGRFYQGKVYSDITQSTLVFHANFETKPLGNDTFTESSSNAATVTIAGSSIHGDGRVTMQSASAGNTATLAKAGAILSGTDYLKVRDITGSPALTWYVGPNSINVSNNSQVYFLYPPSSYANMALLGVG